MRARVWAGITAGAAAIAAIAGVLTNVDTILSKPDSILTKSGLKKPSAVAVTVRLAEMSQKDRETLVLGSIAKDVDAPLVTFLDYAQVGDEFCLQGKPMDGCKGAPAILYQPPYDAIDYFDGEEPLVGPWGPAVPVFDVVSVRSDERDILLVQQSVEYELVEADERPFIQIMGNANREGTVTLVNQSPAEIDHVEINYKFVDIINAEAVEKWQKAERKRIDFTGLDHQARLDAGFFTAANLVRDIETGEPMTERFAYTLDLSGEILKAYPGAHWEGYAGPYAPGGAIRPKYLTGVGETRKYALPKDASSCGEGRECDRVVMIVGQIRAVSAKGVAFRSNFVTPVYVYSNREFGAGDVTVDNSQVMMIGGDRGTVTKPVNLVLNDASPTVRSQVALMFRQSGKYRLRFLFGTNDKKEDMASDWVVVQAYAPPAFIATYDAMLAERGQSGGEE